MKLKQLSINITNSMAANKTSRKFIKWVCFLAYLLLLIYLLFFAEFLGRTGQSEEYRYNLTLFQEIMRYYRIGINSGSWNLFLWNVVGNVVVFMPVGVFITSLAKNGKNILYTTLLSFEISLLFELIQLAMKVGSFDVDDLLLNTLGGLCGYLVYRVMSFFKKKRYKSKR